MPENTEGKIVNVKIPGHEPLNTVNMVTIAEDKTLTQLNKTRCPFLNSYGLLVNNIITDNEKVGLQDVLWQDYYTLTNIALSTFIYSILPEGNAFTIENYTQHLSPYSSKTFI